MGGIEKTIRCLIVDDEPASHKILTGYIKEISWLELAGHCYNGPDALAAIPVLKPDLILLDYRMPGMTGIEMLQEVTNMDIRVILISADRAEDITMKDPRIRGYLQKIVFFDAFKKKVKKVCGIK